jgi:hypothetical protein
MITGKARLEAAAMNPDIRYYFEIIEFTDQGDETIYENTRKLVAKTQRKYPQTTLWVDNIVLPEDYINTTWFFCNNAQMAPKRATVSYRLGRLGDRSELVIRGHGDVANNKVSRVSAEVLARSLHELGFRANCRINITGCNLGRNSNIAGAARGDAALSATAVGSGSFAHVFQAELFKLGLRNIVHARTSNVSVLDDGSKQTDAFDDPDTQISKQPRSKIIFSVDGMGVQTMAFPY